MVGENLWLEFIQCFKPEAIKFINNSQKTKLVNLLRSRKVRVKKGRGVRKNIGRPSCCRKV